MDWAFWPTILELSKWLICLVMLPVVVLRKQQPGAALVWLAIIFLAPWTGLVLYLLIGENRLGRRRLEERRHRQSNLPGTGAHDHEGAPAESSYAEDHTIARLVERLSGWRPTSGNRVTFIADTDLMIERLIADIHQAEDHVHLLFYIFRDDQVGRRVAEALADARRRGVECRVLADGVGSRHMFRTLGRWMRDAGIEVYPILPVRLYRLPFSRLDLRDHRKLAIIDGRFGYVGSQNIVEADYGHPRAGAWQDVMARLQGPVVRQFQRLFVEAWYYESGVLLSRGQLFPPPAEAGEAIVQLIPSGPDMPTAEFHDAMVSALFSARRRITITSPYFVPDDAMLMALRLAVVRGVSVELVVPRRTDHPLVDAASAYFWEYLYRVGVQVFHHTQGMLHAKTLSVDETLGMFGSGNYDIRSFHLNFELNLVLHSPQTVAELVRLQQRYISQSYRVNDAHLRTQRFHSRLAVHTAKLLAPLL